MDISVIKADITKLKVEAIVNPADSYITMGGGLAGIISKLGGEKIKEEAQKYVPVKIGEAIVTSAGKLPSRYIIHAPTMEKPAEKIPVRNTQLATQAVLQCAQQYNIKQIAIPGLGTGVGGVPYREAAKVMLKTARNFKTEVIKRVIFVAYNNELFEEFKQAR